MVLKTVGVASVLLLAATFGSIIGAHCSRTSVPSGRDVAHYVYVAENEIRVFQHDSGLCFATTAVIAPHGAAPSVALVHVPCPDRLLPRQVEVNRP